MRTSNYLYGISVSPFQDLPYKEVLLIKLNSAMNLYKYLVIEEDMKDTERMSEVHKAIQHTRALITELGYGEADISSMLKDYNDRNRITAQA